LRAIAAELSVSHELIRTILTNHLGVKHFAACFRKFRSFGIVPKHLNFLQKLNRMRVAENTLEWVNSDLTYMKCIVTGDETFVEVFDMQTSQQSSEWRLPTEPKSKKTTAKSFISQNHVDCYL
jgi:hypothetical protein